MKWARCRPLPAVSCLLVSFLLAHGVFSSNVVTLESILIYTTHEWLPFQPTIYFRCLGEKKIMLPDVKETNNLYTFKGEESWQPLTELPNKKCKRCGIYEEDSVKHDDIFDEWELCPGDFVDGKYMHFKAKEFNATFRCPSCASSESGSNRASGSTEGSTGKRKNIAVVIVIGVLGSITVIVGLVAGYIYWQKTKKEQDQARFLQLFQEAEDGEHELGMRNANSVEDGVALKDAT